VDGKLVTRAAAEVFGRHGLAGRWRPWAGIGAGLATLALATMNLWQPHTGTAPTPTPAAQFAAAPISAPAVAATPARPEPGPPPVPTPAPLTLQQLLQDRDFVADTDRAIGELLELWGATYDAASGNPCAQAAQQGLRCRFQDRGSLSELRRVNWPTIVSLVDDRGVEHPIVIASLGYDYADIIANGKTFQLSLAELTFYWYGDHLLLWRPGDAPAGDLVPGVRDAGVLWLRQTLGRIRGEEVAPSSASTLYDVQLERRVRDYQRERMLTVDGIVGARTQIALLADLDIPGTPLLLAGH
jgi:peptidoglycan hydrolase-like protein with peptidoglycan-binding domain